MYVSKTAYHYTEIKNITKSLKSSYCYFITIRAFNINIIKINLLLVIYK